MNVDSAKIVSIIKKNIETASTYLSEHEMYELKHVMATILFEIADYMILESEQINGNVEQSNS